MASKKKTTRSSTGGKPWDPDAAILAALREAIVQAHVAVWRRPARHDLYAGTLATLRAAAGVLKDGIPPKGKYGAVFERARESLGDGSKDELREKARRVTEQAIREWQLPLGALANGVHRLLEPWIPLYSPLVRNGAPARNAITNDIAEALRPLVMFDASKATRVIGFAEGSDTDGVLRAALGAAGASSRDRKWWFGDKQKARVRERARRRTSPSVRRIA